MVCVRLGSSFGMGYGDAQDAHELILLLLDRLSSFLRPWQVPPGLVGALVPATKKPFLDLPPVPTVRSHRIVCGCVWFSRGNL